MHHLCQKIREIELLVLKAEPVVAAFSVHSVQVLTLANKVNIFSHTNWGCLSLLASSLIFLTGNDFHLLKCPTPSVRRSQTQSFLVWWPHSKTFTKNEVTRKNIFTCFSISFWPNSSATVMVQWSKWLFWNEFFIK